MLTHNRQLLKKAAVAFLCVSVLGGILAAQTRRKQRGPRAIGVVEITPKGRARLVPIGILVDGKWYDAGIYMANPRPMALDPDTVYEAEKTGTPQGLFTVNAAQEVGGNWVGVGTWKPTTGEQAAPRKAESEKPQSANPEDDDAPPVLRRPGSSKPEAAPGTAQPPASAPAPAEAPKPTASPADASRDQQTAAKTETADDPNRPVLRRGKPAQEQSDEIDDVPAAAPKTADAKTPGTKPQAQSTPVFIETLAAISDATPVEPRSFNISLNPQDREQNTRKMMDLASEAIRKFAVIHPIRGKQAPSVTLADIQARDFDVNGSNDPVLVLSARAPETPIPPGLAKTARAQRTKTPPPTERMPVSTEVTPPAPGAGFEYYVTVVARVDVNGDIRKLFDSVTDTSHLDAIPRLQLIDCVDADGNRVGDLLFREVYDRSRAYIIYRVGMDKLWEVFQSTQMSFGR